MEMMNTGNNEISHQILGHTGDIYAGTLSENTKRAYMNDILDFFGAKNLNEIGIEQIRSVNSATANQYRQSLMEKGYAVSTINRKITSLSSFYSFLARHEIGIVPYNPFSKNEGMKRLRQNKKYSNTRCLTKEEVQEVVKIVSLDTDSTNERTKLLAIRDRIIILLLATTGLRREELTNIRLSMFKYTSGKCIIEFLGKGGVERMAIITPSIKVIIDKYLGLRGVDYKTHPNEPLLIMHTSNAGFYNGESRPISTNAVYEVVKKVCRRAGLDASDISPHSFRHTFVTEALEMGVAHDDVAKLVGHSNTETTKRYDHTRKVIQSNVSETLDKMFNNFD